MNDLLKPLEQYRMEATQHLEQELLPFWIDRCVDEQWGGYITHFDQNGVDSGDDEKSLIAQTRTVYTFASAHRAGYGDGNLAKIARHGVHFLINRMWDEEFGGFYWMVNRKGEVTNNQKILYGHSFAMYALSEYTLATGDPVGLQYAEKVFEIVQTHCTDTYLGGYFEMFWRDWRLKGAGAEGGDRKTLDVHMHLMEAFTQLYECSKKEVHRRKLEEVIEILLSKILHPEYKTGIPQFWRDWRVAPQIKFDIVWGWDRFTEDGLKKDAEDNTSYGHNVEFAWLLRRALDILETPYDNYIQVIEKQFNHALADGIDWEHGGVFVEGSHSGGVYDREKEFWQNAEMLIALLDACLLFGPEKYWPVYENVHRFVFDKMIHHEVGEWWPLMTRDGKPIWTHMSHSWKVNYHTVRSMVQVIDRLKRLEEQLPKA
jgi:mannobiose 2-epimerase